MKKGIKGWKMGAAVLAGLLVLTGCSGNNGSKDAASPSAPATDSPSASPESSKPLKEVKVVLDWTPNTNHTGLYVARDKGFWEKRGLKVEIVQPPETGASQMVASGAAQFGVGYQEDLTLGRENGVPLVSLAAIIQHNTSGFASPVAKNIKSPKDFEGKTYGGWGSPVEQAVIETLMKEQGADPSKVKIVNIGTADYFTAVKRDIDFAWIYYAWTGVESETRKENLNMVWMKDYDKRLDYYTPLLMTGEKMIQNDPDVVRAFTEGAAEGYKFAIDHPDEAADVLIQAVPELNKDLVRASQKWLSSKYQDDAPRWGEQKKEVWEGYADWMTQHGIMKKKLNFDEMFTNEFLPK
ncbi:ABC transporter substrate-binding protein [Cohnella pontilimi]|uniref:ABC transporter substrate-binding protein n=1 Tax=Cohnella pontilimi TaxID=2564100 RepID=A0A4U0FEL9_9BACL|nr:ABC transporter substrate-binding protein [Cohnella pontilimi]TJY43240.1 ABC transporter substrate-binding protein [Cohnella pontilimi]